jgi:DNA-directed RNA polymerase subunit RPC12/RpoP
MINMRTLEDMKRDRGGHCMTCGKDIMSPDQKDHSFCNDCWYDMLKHTFESENDEPICAQCGEVFESPYHPKPVDDKWSRIAGV